MPKRFKHADDEPVLFSYSSNWNISFDNRHSPDESGYTWGDWRKMSQASRDEAVQDYLNELVEVYVVEDES